MASPFRTFRKNQKTWMAGITIMAIVAFVFMSNPSQYVGRGGGSVPVVVRTRFGNLTQREVGNLRVQRAALLRFVAVLQSQFEKNSQPASVLDAFMRLLGPDTEDEAVNRWVYARTAESMGVVVDNTSVNDLFKVMTAGAPDPQKLITAVVTADREMNEALLFNVMREQMLALRLMQLGHLYDDWAGWTASPGERWNYFKRLHQQAMIEVAVLAPKDYVKEVKDPSADELKKFFEEHKEVESSPESPAPGFRVPRKVNVQYLEADPERYESLITDAEIDAELKKHPEKYARNKEDFEKQEKEERDARAKQEKEEAAKANAEKKPATEPKMNETKPEAKEPAKGETKSSAAPETKPDAKADLKAEPKTETKPDAKLQATPEVPKTPEPAKPSTTGTKPAGTSAVARPTPFRLVAFAEEKPADNAPAAASTAKTTAAAPASKAAEAAKAADTNKPAEDKKPVEDKKPADEKKPAAGSKPTEEKKSTAEKPSDNKPLAADERKKDSKEDAAKKEPPKPIKSAEQRLREMVRQELAVVKFRDNVAKVRATLEDYRSEWVKAGEEKPKSPDFAALAKQYMMTAKITGLVSKRELQETDLGKSAPQNADSGTAIDEIFGPTTLYKVEVSFSSSYMTSKPLDYIFWKTDDQSGGVPKWDGPGVQEKVRDVWKLAKARELAEKDAEALKNEASAAKGKDGKSLKELVGKKQQVTVMEPPKFTWLTSLVPGMMPTLSEVGDLNHIGADFMQKVFSLTPDQVSVATNLSKSEVYVVRVVSMTPFKELWEKYTSDETAQDYLAVMIRTVHAEVDPAWRAQILKDADFKDQRTEQRKANERQPAPLPEPEGQPPPEDL